MTDALTSIPPEPSAEALTGLVESANTMLETAVNQATHQAFNLGCLLGLLPALIFGVVMFLAANFSFIGASMALALGVVSAIAFANLAAMITRNNTLRRVYREHVLPEIERGLREAGKDRAEFDRAARTILPPSAPLYPFIGAAPAPARAPAPGDS